MEIEEFIEQDILVFLDDRLDKPRSSLAVRQRTPIKSQLITRDYEYEFFMMLDRKDLDGAKNVLHDLKEKFDECPNNSPEKLQLKSLLLDLYEKFKDHLDARDTFSRIDSQLGGKNELKPPQAAPAAQTTTPDAKDAEPVPAPSLDMTPPTAPGAAAANAAPIPAPTLQAAASPAAPPAMPPLDVTRINTLLDDAEHAFFRGDMRAAALSYRDAKRQILAANDAASDMLVERCMSVFTLVHGRIDASRSTQSAPSLPPLPEIPIRRPAAASSTPPATIPFSQPDSMDADRQALLLLEQEKRGLDACIQAGDLLGAMRRYRVMRLYAQQVRDRDRAASVAAKLQTVYDAIRQMQQHTAAPERTLTGARP